MAKLSSIFNNINNYETEKQKYFAEKLISSYMVDNGLLTESHSLQFVEDKIIAEAIKYGSLDKALEFVDGIVTQSTQLDEGFMDTVKKAGTWVKDKAIAIKDAIVNWFKGATVTALKKFHTDISDDYAALKEGDEDEDEETPAIEGGEEQKQLTASLKTDHSLDYLMEATPTPEADAPTEAMDDISDDADNGVTAMAFKLFNGKVVPTGKKTGSTQKRIKFYAITKSGVNSTLWVGPSNDIKTMKVLTSYMKSSKKLFLNLAKDVVSTQLEMDLIKNLLLAIKSNPDLNPDGVFKSVEQAGKKVVLEHGTKKIQLIPGKLVILAVEGKSKLPIKLKKAVTQEKFKGVFGIEKQTGDEAVDTDVVANNANKEDGKPVKYEAGHESETTEEFEARMEKWSDAEDNKDLGDDVSDDSGKDLATELVLYFKQQKIIADPSELNDFVKTLQGTQTFVKSAKIDLLNDFNDNLGDYLIYIRKQETDIDITPIITKLAEIYKDKLKDLIKPESLTLITDKKAITDVTDKATYDRFVILFAEFKNLIKRGAGIEVVNPYSEFEEEESPANIEKQFVKAHTIIFNGTDAVENATSFFGQDETSNLKFTLEQAKTFVIKLEAAVKTPENQKLLFEKFKGLTGKAMFDAVVMFINEVPAGDITPPPKVKKVDITNPAQWIDAVVKGSGAMNVDTFFLEKMKVDNKLLWKNFKSFATENQNSLAEIMFSIDDAEHHGKMSPNEFVLFATRVPTILKYVESQVKKDLLDPQDFSKEAFTEFITDIIPAANTMSSTITGDIGKKDTKTVDANKNLAGAMSNNERTKQGVGTEGNDETLVMIKEEFPELYTKIETLANKDTDKMLAMTYIFEDFPNIKFSDLGSYVNIPGFMDDSDNFEQKITFIGGLQKLNAPKEMITKIISEGIVGLDIVDSFTKTAPFTTPAEAIAFVTKGGDFASNGLEIFNKSIIL